MVERGSGSPGRLHVGDAVKLFSKTANVWIRGKVTELPGTDLVCVQYEIDQQICRKTLHLETSQRLSTGEDCVEEYDLGCKQLTPVFKEGDEVHYYRMLQRGDGENGVWTYATVKKVTTEDIGIFYELDYDAWDEIPAHIKKKGRVSQVRLLGMQELRNEEALQQGSARREGTKQSPEGSLSQSIPTKQLPNWCRGVDDHVKALGVGDQVYFWRSNGDPVCAKIEAMHNWEDDVTAHVDLIYEGIDDQGDPRHMRKKNVTRAELAVAHHPRNHPLEVSGIEVRAKSNVNCDQHSMQIDEQQCAASAGQPLRSQLHAASRVGDLELVASLLQKRVDPRQRDERDGSTALHVAAYHGHGEVVEMLMSEVSRSFGTSELLSFLSSLNSKGESPLDVARERLKFCPSNSNACTVFQCVFGRDPRAQEMASRVLKSDAAREIRTINQSFVEAIVECPLIGNRSQPFDIDTCDINGIADGIEDEERRVKEYERPEYDDWSYWRASFDRGIRRHGVQDALSRRMCAREMRQCLLAASCEEDKLVALCRAAIKLYTVASFLFKATNFAMRNKGQASKLTHLKPYAQLLNHSVRYYAHKQPWKGRVHRVLPIYSAEMLKKYKDLDQGPADDSQRFFSWSGFISATAWDQDAEKCCIFDDLCKYGAGMECIVFIIDPAPGGGSVYPIDLREMAAFGPQDRELLYPAGQQFKFIEYVGTFTRKKFAEDFNIQFDPPKDADKVVRIIRLQAVDVFLKFASDFFKDDGDIAAAEKVLRNRLQEAQQARNEDEEQKYMGALAKCLHHMGRHAEAELFLRRTLNAMEGTLGPNHPDTLTIRNDLAVLLRAMGKHAEAEPIFRQAFKAMEDTLGPTHPNTLATRNNLAGLLCAMGRHAEAEPHFRSTLKETEAKLGPTHPNTLTGGNNLALLLQDMGRHAEAEPLIRRTLKAREDTLGPTHPDTLTSRTDLALLLFAMGKHAEAEPIFRQALKAMEDTLGPTHPNTLTSRNNLALLLHDVGRHAEAEPLVRRTLKAREDTLGPTHPDTLTCRSNLAGLLRDMGRHAEAEPLLRRTLNAMESTLGPAHPNTLNSRNDLALLLFVMGKQAEAEPIFRQALMAMEDTLGPTHPNTLTSRNNLAGLLHAMGRHAEAEPIFRQALKAREDTLGPTHPDTVGSRNDLALLLQDMGRH